MDPRTYKTVTPPDWTDTVWGSGARWTLRGHVDGDTTCTLYTTPVVRIDRTRHLVETESGRIYHVPGPWPDDLDIPYMRAPVEDLPPGWTWADEDHTEARHAGFGLRVIVRGAVGREVVAIVGNVRADVVEMTIARHRARAGGAA